jgi:hypothetical protein
MQVLATTSGGDGVRSAPIYCQTEQDGKRWNISEGFAFSVLVFTIYLR